MLKFLKRLWVEFWWGKPIKLTPAEKKAIIRQNQQIQRAHIQHKRNHKKRTENETRAKSIVLYHTNRI